jgi:hypothetical protein
MKAIACTKYGPPDVLQVKDPRDAQRDRLVVKHLTSGTKTVRKSVYFCVGILA